MKRFILYILLFITPLIALIIPYFATDPFKVLYHYDRYSQQGEPMYININRTMVSERMFEQYYSTYHWNSYIFGSSRSGFYRVADWKQHLDSAAIVMHMDGYGESLYGIWCKLTYMDGKTDIDNALLCIDYELLYQTKPELGSLWAPLPHWSHNQVDWWQFHKIYMRAYLQPKFLYSYFLFLLGDTTHVDKTIIDFTPDYLDISTNERSAPPHPIYAYNIPDSVFYTAERMKQFYNRPDEQMYYESSVLGEEQVQMLMDIKQVLERNATNYRVVINPMYDQKRMMDADMDMLYGIFGDKLYDFSGINEFTSDFHNYNDIAHFKAFVAREIMNQIY